MMNDETNLNSDSTPESTTDTNVDYIEAIKELKANSVSKDDYNKLKAENKKLVSSLINGETVEGVEAPKQVDIGTLRKELFDANASLSNLDYVTKALELRDTLIEEGQVDPFLPYGHNIAPTAQDIEAANRVAATLKDCVEYADGDSALFTAELQRVMIDAVPAKGKKK